MHFLKSVAAAAVASLLATSAYAGPSPSNAAPASRMASPSSNGQQLMGGTMLPLLALLVAVVVVAALASGHNHMPKSP